MTASTPTPHTFTLTKAVAAIAYLVRETSESLYPIMKMIYLAEKCHLERYGRMITGDRYVAMSKGPVPSAAYDMMKFVRGDRQYFEGGDLPRAVFTYDRPSHAIGLSSDPDLSSLSLSEIECLDEIIAYWRANGSRAITKASHDDAWRATTENSDIAVASIAAQTADAATLVQHLNDRFPGAAN